MAVQIEFDKTRTLKFDLSAVRDLEASLGGKPLGDVIHDIQRMGVNVLVVALWAGLKHEDKSLNMSLVTKMLEKYLQNKGSLRPLARGIDEALTETGLFNSDGDDDEGNAQPEPAASA